MNKPLPNKFTVTNKKTGKSLTFSKVLKKGIQPVSKTRLAANTKKYG